MPTSTFLNLPEDKRESILSAARKEFSNVPYADASINKIIKYADIPRGSFYMYFEDKKDLATFLMNGYMCHIRKSAEHAVSNPRGDIFDVFLQIYDNTAKFLSKTADNTAALKNIIIGLHSEFGPPGPLGKPPHGKFLFELDSEKIKSLNRDSLNVKSDAEFSCLLEILSSMLKTAVIMTFKNVSDAKKYRKQLLIKLNLIKHGALKNNEDNL